jgi:hypothetical protein
VSRSRKKTLYLQILYGDSWKTTKKYIEYLKSEKKYKKYIWDPSDKCAGSTKTINNYRNTKLTNRNKKKSQNKVY